IIYATWCALNARSPYNSSALLPKTLAEYVKHFSAATVALQPTRWLGTFPVLSQDRITHQDSGFNGRTTRELNTIATPVLRSPKRVSLKRRSGHARWKARQYLKLALALAGLLFMQLRQAPWWLASTTATP